MSVKDKSRNVKTFYFPHYLQARNEKRIKALRRRYGWEGYGKWEALLEIFAESQEQNYCINFDDDLTIEYLCEELNFDNTEDLLTFISDCKTFKLLSESDNEGFYYADNKEHLDKAVEISSKRKSNADKRWDKEKIEVMAASGSSAAKMESRFYNNDSDIVTAKKYTQSRSYQYEDHKEPMEEIPKYKTDVGLDIDIWDSGEGKYFIKEFDKLIFMDAGGKYQYLNAKHAVKTSEVMQMQKTHSMEEFEEAFKELQKTDAILDAISIHNPTEDEKHALKLKKLHMIRSLIESLECPSSLHKITNKMDKEAARRLYKIVSMDYNFCNYQNVFEDEVDDILKFSKDYSFRIKSLYTRFLMFLNQLRKEDKNLAGTVIDKIIKEYKPL